jgi:hypothetical protein
VFFLGGQLGLDLALSHWWALRDPEYGLRLTRLRARLAERQPGRPLVVCLGSSRVGTGVRPGVLPASQSGSGNEAIVFNFGLSRSNPVMEVVCLRRLLADGIRPNLLLVELWPAVLPWGAAETHGIVLERLQWPDLCVLGPYCARPQSIFRQWLKEQLLPWLSYRCVLFNEMAPSWVDPLKRMNGSWDGLDAWGWLQNPYLRNNDDQAAWRYRLEGNRPGYVSVGNAFQVTGFSQRALEELFAVCQREKITVALLLMPDLYLSGYSPDARKRMDNYTQSLSTEHGIPVIDARDWCRDVDFCDGIHLTYSGAAAFTERLGRQVLQPYLTGQPISPRVDKE